MKKIPIILNLSLDSLAKIQEVTDVDLKKTYKELNKKMFNNELPNIPIRWSRSTKMGGAINFTWKISTGILIPDSVKMQVSKIFKRELEDFKLIFIHEMIHVWVLFKSGITAGELDKINGKRGHGKIFLKKRKELNNKFNLDIPLTDELRGGVSDNIKIPETGFVLLKFNGNPRLAGYTRNFYNKNFPQIKMDVMNNFRGVEPKMMFMTKAPESFRFKKSKSLKRFRMEKFTNEELTAMLTHPTTKIFVKQADFDKAFKRQKTSL